MLENARLLQEEQSKHQLEDELRLARTIQQSLLPRSLPSDDGRASGSSPASHEVGGDYYDADAGRFALLERRGCGCLGKGVSSACWRRCCKGRCSP